jgi:hypothetical protein
VSGAFRIGWGDRLRGLLFGEVRAVRASTPPVVVRSQYGGAAFSLDDDAFGFYVHPEDRYLPRGGPWLTVEVPPEVRAMACPCCHSVVDARRIRRPHPAALRLAAEIQRQERAIDARQGGAP